MATLWFILAALFVVMYLFNGNVPTTPATKVAINVIAIIGAVILGILAAVHVTI